MSVDLPSSTEPHVTRRSSSACCACSEIADTFAVLHRCLGEAVVGPRLAAFGHSRRRDLVDYLGDRRRIGHDATGARHVADGAEADAGREGVLALHALDVLARGVQHPVAPEDLALVRKVDLRQLQVLPRDVLPDVELRPVRDREHADVLALPDTRVVDVPELGTLRARVPLPEVVAEREDPLLGPGALLVAPRTADRGVELVLLDRIEQRRRLQPVSRRARPGLLDDAALVDRLLHRRDDQPLAELLHAAVAELDHLGEVVAGVDVHDRERELARPECLLGEPEQHDRVLAAGEEQHRPLELGSHLAEDVNRLRLEVVEMRQRPCSRTHTVTLLSISSSSSSRARTSAADSAGACPSVWSRSSGFEGTSYGSSTPVKCSISPAIAFL